MTEDTEDKKTRRRAAWLRIDRSHGYCHPVLAFGSVQPRDYDGETFRHDGWSGRYDMAHPYTLDLEDFQVTAQGEWATPDRLYGWDLEYNKKHRVRSEDVAGMTKTFATLQRTLTKTRATAGEPGTWADFALRVCTALKIECLFVRRADHAQQDHMHSSVVHYGTDTLRDGLYYGSRMCWTDGERETAERGAA